MCKKDPDAKDWAEITHYGGGFKMHGWVGKWGTEMLLRVDEGEAPKFPTGKL